MSNTEVNNHVWNGSTWVPATPASGAVSGSVAVTNLPATQPVSGSVAVSNLPGTQPVSGSVSVSNLPATQPVSGTVGVNNFPATQPVSMAAAPGGTTAVSMAAAPGGTTAVSMAAPPTPINTATGALTLNRVTSAATTNASVNKGSAGRLFKLVISNGSASVRFFKVYNKATAPTVGTDIPILVVLCPAGQCTQVSFGEVNGVYCSAGIGLAITGAMADSDTTAIAAGDVTATILYL